ncbi:hypothetical protein O6H91_17G068000 [Diphasiastrum complanatum]|uniref:Uncharacterized protein n=1 Tax=Diphasiastrum complanatum TaxID=34168 RepID=A0ACC2B7Y0_DIPCM|nr:hypothetical protein O6H91_17G068000 [Diphasiastrum complanatum]
MSSPGSTSSFSLHAVAADPRSLAPFITAEASGASLSLASIDKLPTVSLSPLINGSSSSHFVFSSDSNDFYLQEPLSICRYISETTHNSFLYPEIGSAEHATVEGWLEWSETVVRGVVENVLAGKADHKELVDRLKKLYNALEEGKSFVVGQTLTIADIAIWSQLYPVLGDIKKHSSKTVVADWLNSLALLEPFKAGLSKALGGLSPHKMVSIAKSFAESGAKAVSENGTRSHEQIASVSSPGCPVVEPQDENAPRVPIPGKRNILITSALPYVNNVPHLGNIIGSVLSADVYARYCRLRGYNVIYMCGTDEYGTATETKAMEENVTPRQICDKYHDIHKEIYEWFDISFDKFGRTSTPQQTEICQAIFKQLLEKEQLIEDKIEQLFCSTCDRFLADRFVEGSCPTPGCGYEDARGDQCDKCGKLLNPTELINPRCKVCGKTPHIRETEHLFLDLPKLKAELDDYVTKTSIVGGWSLNSIQTTNAWIRDGLKPRCITRDLKWGVPVPLEKYKNKVFYVWFDAPIGYISITANYTSDWEKWWQAPDSVELVQFMGKDNVPFHTVIFPCTLLGTGKPWTLMRTISVSEYLNYEAGKFSKSRGIGVFGNDAKTTNIPIEVWRYYLLTNRPEVSDTLFTWTDLQAKQNNELLKNLGNFVHRSLSFVAKPTGEGYASLIPTASGAEGHELTAELGRKVGDYVIQYVEAMEKVKLKAGLRIAMSVSSLGNLYLQDSKFWKLYKEDPPACAIVLKTAIGLVRLLTILLEPFIPSFSRKVLSQLNLPLSSLVLLRENGDIERTARPWELVSSGHAIGKPEPIFSEMKDEEVEYFRQKFSGTQAERAAAVSSAEMLASVSVPVSSSVTAANDAPGKRFEPTSELQTTVTKGSGTCKSINSDGKRKGGAPQEGKFDSTNDAAVTVARLDIRVGLITQVKKHPDADSLYVEEIDIGEAAPRTVVSGLVKFIPLEKLQNKKVCVLCNLKPATMRGIKSQAMVLAASNNDHTIVELVTPPQDAAVGERVKFPGFEGEPDDLLNPKKKVWETVQPDLHTTEALVAVYKSAPFTTSAGVCTVSSIREGSIR